MGKFLLGLVVALAIAAGVYYFMLMDVQEAQNTDVPNESPRGADLNLQAAPRVPEGAVMEDGTLD
jgi:hypothetical protein